jgi:hypothetical protein
VVRKNQIIQKLQDNLRLEKAVTESDETRKHTGTLTKDLFGDVLNLSN